MMLHFDLRSSHFLLHSSAFGRPTSRRNGKPVDGGYPQIHVVFLSETGTHLIVEAFIKQGKHGEFPIAASLLRKIPLGSVVLWDRGFYGYASLQAARRCRAEVLGRVADHVVFERLQTLADGSYLAVIYPSWSDRRRRAKGMTVRVIDYTLDDPQRGGHGERHRLVTTLLDAQAFPATELVVLYHERWEIKIGNDELKTHQPLTRRAGFARRCRASERQAFAAGQGPTRPPGSSS